MTDDDQCSYNSYKRDERMISVGVRQLKNSLTHYLRLVDQGQSLLVTSRNRAVAVVRKPDLNSSRSRVLNPELAA